MDPLKAVDALAEAARKERPPEMHVSPAVLRRIRSRQPLSTRPLWLVASAAAAAAAVVLYLAAQSWVSPSEPLMEFFAPLQVVSL